MKLHPISFSKIFVGVIALVGAGLALHAQLNVPDSPPFSALTLSRSASRNPVDASGRMEFLGAKFFATENLAFDQQLNFENAGVFPTRETANAASELARFDHGSEPANIAGVIESSFFQYSGVHASSEIWSDETVVSSASTLSWNLPRLIAAQQPTTYGLIGALGFAALLAMRRVQHQSVALAG